MEQSKKQRKRASKRTPNKRATASKAKKTGKRTQNTKAASSKAKKVVKKTGMSNMLKKKKSPPGKASNANAIVAVVSGLSAMFKQKN